VAVLSDAGLIPGNTLSTIGATSESEGSGFYAIVVEDGAFPHTESDRFARRILDASGRMPPGQVLLRPRKPRHDEQDLTEIGYRSDENQPVTRTNLEAARKEWAKLFPRSVAMKRVVIDDMETEAPSKLIRESSFSAWTNSPTHVYVADLDTTPSAWRAVLYHESLHALQFLAANGQPPSTYSQMMRYECSAYGKSALWLRDPWLNPQTSEVKGYANQSKAKAVAICNTILNVGRKRRPDRERLFKEFLTRHLDLPEHKLIQDLYSPS
jgi:hypothetical protein